MTAPPTARESSSKNGRPNQTFRSVTFTRKTRANLSHSIEASRRPRRTYFSLSFPTLRNAKFISEGVVWFAISRRFKTRFVNEVLRIYHIDDNAEDRLTSLSPTTMFGRAFFHKYVLNELIEWCFSSPLNILRSAINFSRYSFGLGKGPYSPLRELGPLVARLLVAISLPLAFAMFLKDKYNVARAGRRQVIWAKSHC